MSRRIPMPNSPRLTQPAGHQASQYCACPRRRQVDEIVEPRRRPAEVPVPRRLVADHRVKRVDRPIPDQPRDAEQPTPKQRRNRRIRRVLRHRLDSRASQLIRRQVGRIPAAEVAQSPASRFEILRLQMPSHHRGLALQAAPAEHRPSRNRRQQRLGDWPVLGQPLGDNTGRCHRTDEQPRVRRTGSARIGVQAGLEPSGRLAEARHRMAPSRIAQPAISGEAEEKTEGSGHDAKSARPGKFKGGRSVEG